MEARGAKEGGGGGDQSSFGFGRGGGGGPMMRGGGRGFRAGPYDRETFIYIYIQEMICTTIQEYIFS